MSRSQWKFNYLGSDFRSITDSQETPKSLEYVLQNRSTKITEDMLGLQVKVYNGIKYFSFLIENDMIGHCLGEFAPTKKKALKKKKIKVKLK